jgi:hypothetical protein
MRKIRRHRHVPGILHPHRTCAHRVQRHNLQKICFVFLFERSVLDSSVLYDRHVFRGQSSAFTLHSISSYESSRQPS